MLVVQLNVPALRQLRRLLDMLQDEGLYALPYGSCSTAMPAGRLAQRRRLRSG